MGAGRGGEGRGEGRRGEGRWGEGEREVKKGLVRAYLGSLPLPPTFMT